MHFNAMIHTTARVKVIQSPARLEQARRMREATPAVPHRSRFTWQIGVWMNRAGEWLQGVPRQEGGQTQMVAGNPLSGMPARPAPDLVQTLGGGCRGAAPVANLLARI